LSRRVAELEARLGVRLLQRTTRSLSLTEVGQAYLRHCLALRDAAQAAQNTVEQVHSEPRGTVRVTCPVTLAQSVLAELLPHYLVRHPAVRLELEVSNRVVHVVEEGVDVALRVRSQLDDGSSMVVKRLGEGRQVLVAAPAQIARQGAPTAPDDLTRMDTLAMSAREGRASLCLQGPGGRQQTVQLAPRFVADDLVTLQHAALAGVGLCWLPDYMALPAIEAGHLVHVLPEWTPAHGIVHAVFSSRRGLAPAVRSFLDFLGEELPPRVRLQARV
ncbi:LysR substrate-binding domain-containing protein, partial [Melaminivora sp.]|uniref:LysR substrate-binding domain-containing protein n=1 Tax=Melaminivora sp. TaxID=1933032 RepID=UPI0028AF4B67